MYAADKNIMRQTQRINRDKTLDVRLVSKLWAAKKLEKFWLHCPYRMDKGNARITERDFKWQVSSCSGYRLNAAAVNGEKRICPKLLSTRKNGLKTNDNRARYSKAIEQIHA